MFTPEFCSCTRTADRRIPVAGSGQIKRLRSHAITGNDLFAPDNSYVCPERAKEKSGKLRKTGRNIEPGFLLSVTREIENKYKEKRRGEKDRENFCKWWTENVLGLQRLE